MQWRNRRAECPLTFFTGKFLLTYQEKRGKEERGKKGKWGGKEGNLKGKRWKFENERGKGIKMSRGLFILLFSFRFLKPLKFVWGGQFLPGKIIFHAWKKSGKLNLPPLKKKIPLTPLTRWLLILVCVPGLALGVDREPWLLEMTRTMEEIMTWDMREIFSLNFAPEEEKPLIHLWALHVLWLCLACMVPLNHIQILYSFPYPCALIASKLVPLNSSILSPGVHFMEWTRGGGGDLLAINWWWGYVADPLFSTCSHPLTPFPWTHSHPVTLLFSMIHN